MVALGFWKVQQTGVVYKAQARISIEGSAPNRAAAELLGLTHSINRVNTQAQMLLSTRVLSEVV